MNKVRKVLYISLIVALAAVIVLLIIFCIYSFDCKDIPKSLEILAPTFTAITSSLGVIIGAINILEIRKQFKENKKAEVFEHWYRNLIINRYLHEIKDFFYKCEESINCKELEEKHKELKGEEYDELVFKQIIEPFTHRYTKLHRDLILDLKIIDKKLSDSVSRMFSDFQDEFTEHFDQKHINAEKIQVTIKKHYGNIVGNLMKYDMNYMN